LCRTANRKEKIIIKIKDVNLFYQRQTGNQIILLDYVEDSNHFDKNKIDYNE